MGMYRLVELAFVKIPASDPLTLDAYIDFFLIPYIAAWLIGEDKDTDLEGGWEIMQKDGDHGEDENPIIDDDPVLEDVFIANVKRSKAMAEVDRSNGQHKQTATQALKADKENVKPRVRGLLFINIGISDGTVVII
jgi:hypothetical protein